MFRRASHLLLLAGLLAFSQQASAASKVVALLIGNDSLDLGLKQGDLNVKLEALRANLFNYGEESIISGGVNLPKEDMQARIREFQDRLPGAEAAIFYYTGRSAHNASDGRSYLIPRGWDGSSETDLIPIRDLLERMRSLANGRAVVFIEALKPEASAWRVASIKPGLGSVGREVGADGLQVVFVDSVAGSVNSQWLLTGGLMRQLEADRIKFPQLASLVQDDVSFMTGGVHVPRLHGSVGGATVLKRLSKAEVEAKEKKCSAARDRPDHFMISDGKSGQVAEIGEPLPTQPMRLAGRPGEPGEESLQFWWICPESAARPAGPAVAPSAAVQRNPTGSQPGTRRAASAGEANRSNPAARGYGGGGGSAGARAAASGAGVP